jgi:Carboxypeptidase regulatory-like domain
MLRRPFVAVLVLTLLNICIKASEATATTVAGVVVDADGLEVPNTSVSAMPIGDFVGDFHWIDSDDHGRFEIDLRPGRYIIRAKNPPLGYPDPSFLLCEDPNARFPEIVVGQKEISNVRVILGLKGGVLEGYVRDKLTRELLRGAKITIADSRNPGVFVKVSADKSGSFQFTVPSKPISVSAVAPGYKMAYYATSEELKLSGGTHRSIVIELEHAP